MLEEENCERERERENAKPEDRSTLAMARLPYNSCTVACILPPEKKRKNHMLVTDISGEVAAASSQQKRGSGGLAWNAQQAKERG